jgi:addiction module HigA family antidote
MTGLIKRDALAAVDLSDVVTGERIGPVTPGDVLRTEFMQPLGISARGLARDIDVPANRITEIVKGQRSISAETAVLLGFRFETSAEFWLNLQLAHDLEMARHASREKFRERLELLRNGKMRPGKISGAGTVDTTRQAIARLERWTAVLDAIA